MSKKSNKKKVVVGKSSNHGANKKKVAATVSRIKGSAANVAQPKQELIFGRQNYIMMAGGGALVLLGMLMMVGGSMPDPNTWDPDIIYSKRITLLGPMLILAGLIIEIFAIFKR